MLACTASPPRAASREVAARAGRGVLDGAFAVLEALAGTENGLGLSALARASGLAKTSAYRLAEQLTELGAVQHVDCRYYIGPRIGHIGQCWQPNPALRRAGQAPVRTLAVQSGAVVSLRVLHEDGLRAICSTVPRGHACVPIPADPESIARTATGRVLYAAQLAGGGDLPGCWTPREWQKLRESIRDLRATVVDHHEIFPDISCVSAPVWWPDGSCAAALTAVVRSPKPVHNLRDLVACAARRTGAALRGNGPAVR